MPNDDAERTNALQELNLWATDMQADDETSKRRILAVLEPLLVRQGYRLDRETDIGGYRFDLVAECKADKVGVELRRFRAGELYRDDVVDVFAAYVAGTNEMARGLVIANAGLLDETLERVRTKYGADIQLYDVERLRKWINDAYLTGDEVREAVVEAVRRLSRELVKLVASNIDALMSIEWRDLERLVAEVFDGLGFDVILTPSTKDGGKDVIVTGVVKGKLATYYIEVKHWRTGKQVGVDPIKSFISVVASKDVAGGLFLSSSGYTSDVETCAEIKKQRVTLGGQSKVQTLCRRFESVGNGLLCPVADLESLITDVE